MREKKERKKERMSEKRGKKTKTRLNRKKEQN